MTQQPLVDTQRSASSGPEPGQRKLGAKGRRTRQQLIDTTVALLETHGLRDLSVVDVARAVGSSPGTFYVYFKGVPEVVLAALEDATQTSPELEAIIARDWATSGGGATAREFVECYTNIWNRNRTIFVVRNLAAEEGDARFYEARMNQARPMMIALSSQVARAQLAGRVPSHLAPRSCAGTILMMLERLSAIGPMSRDDDDVGYADLKAAAAHSIAMMLGATD